MVFEAAHSFDADDILDIIPAAKISLLPNNYFDYPRTSTVAGAVWNVWMGGKKWPSSDQLANMTVAQANTLLSLWTKYQMASEISWSQFFSATASLYNPWTLAINALRTIATVDVINNSLPSNNIFEETLAGLSDEVREQLDVVPGADGSLSFAFSHINFETRSLNFITHLPKGLIALLNTTVIDRIARADHDALVNADLAFSKDSFSVLNNVQVAQYLHAWRNNLGEPEILPLRVLNNLAGHQVAMVDADQLAMSITIENISNLSTDVIAALSAEQLQKWTRAQLQALTPAQIMYIDPLAIGALGARLSDFTNIQYDHLLNDQIAEIQDINLIRSPDQYILLSPAKFALLSNDQLRSIPELVMSQIAVDNLAALSKAQVEALIPSQVWALDNAQFLSLTNRSLRGSLADLSSLTILGLSKNQVVGARAEIVDKIISNLGQSALQLLNGNDLAKIPPRILAELSPTALSYLTNSQVLNLRQAQIDALDAAQKTSLPTAPGPAILLTTTQIRALAMSQIMTLNGDLISDFSALQFKALVNHANFSNITGDQLQSLGYQVLNSLNSSEWDLFSNAQIASLPAETLGSLNSYAKNIIDTRFGIVIDGSGRRAQQLNNIMLTTQQIQKLSSLSPVNFVSYADTTGTYRNPYLPVTLIRWVLEFNKFTRGHLSESRKKDIDRRRQYLQGWRFLGSLLYATGAAASWERARTYETSLYQKGMRVMTGLGWIASALQAPISAWYSGRALYNQRLADRIAQTRPGTPERNSAAEWAMRGVWETRWKSLGLDGVYNSAFAQYIIKIFSKNNAVSPQPTFVRVQEAGTGDDLEIGVETRPALPIEQVPSENAVVFGVPAMSNEMRNVIEKNIPWYTLDGAGAFNINEVTFTDKNSVIWTRTVVQKADDSYELAYRFMRDVGQTGNAEERENELVRITNEYRPVSLDANDWKNQISASLAETTRRSRFLAKAKNTLVLGEGVDVRLGLLKGGWIYLIANTIAVANNSYALYMAIDGRPETPTESLIRTGSIVGNAISLLGSCFYWLGDNINTFAAPGARQAKLGSFWLSFGLALSYIGGTVAEIARSSANARDSNSEQQDSFKRILDTNTIVLTVRLALLGASAIIFNGWKTSAISSAALAVIPFLLSTVEYVPAISYLENKKTELLSQGRTVEAEICDSLKDIENHAMFWGQADIVLYKQKTYENIRNNMIENNNAKFYQMISELEKARLIYTQDGLAQFGILMNEMNNSIIASTDIGYNDTYIINADRLINSEDYYLTDEDHRRTMYYFSLLHVSTTAFTANTLSNFVPTLNGAATSNPTSPSSSTPTQNPTSTYPQVVVAPSNFITHASDYVRAETASYENTIVLTDSGLGTSYVRVTASSDYTNENVTPITIDATRVTKRMEISVEAAKVIINTTDNSGVLVTITTTSSQTNSTNVIPRKLSETEFNNIVSTLKINGTAGNLVNELTIKNTNDVLTTINLDNFVGTKVISEGTNNFVTGTKENQFYVGLLGKNIVNLMGGGSSVTVRGYGNTVNMANGGNLLQVGLLTQLQKTMMVDPVEIGFTPGEYDGGAVVTTDEDRSQDNTISFASIESAVKIDIIGATNSDVENIAGTAMTLTNSGTVIDQGNFKNFGNVIGAVAGSYVTIANQTKLHTLILGAGNNYADVSNTNGLNIEASGSYNEVFFHEAVGSSNINYIHTNGGNSHIIAYANTTIGAVLEGVSDELDLSRDSSAKFNLIEVGKGTHTILLNNNAGADATHASLIKMQDAVVGDLVNSYSVTNIIDNKTRRIEDNAIYIQLAMNIADFNVNYEGGEIHFETKDGMRQLNYKGTMIDHPTTIEDAQSNAYLIVNPFDEEQTYLMDTNVLIHAMATMGGDGKTMSMGGSGSYNAYDLMAVFVQARSMQQS